MKTLLRTTNWVGDVAMSLPALKALRSSLPKDSLAVLCRPWVADLYRLRPEVDAVIVEENGGVHAGEKGRARLAAELKERRFDRALLFPTSFETAFTLYRAGIPERIGYRGELRDLLLTRPVRPSLEPGDHQIWKHLLLVAAAGAAIPEFPDASWSVAPPLVESGRKRLREAGWEGGRFVAAHAASFAHAAKHWDLVRFAVCFDRLARERGFSVVLLGSEAERKVNEELAGLLANARTVNLSGRSTLPEVLGILSLAALFVGNDSGLAHLSGAVGAPTLVVFGPTDPEATRPWDGPRGDGKPVKIRVVRRRVLCAPCRFPVCPIDHACMEGLPADAVADAAEELLRAG